MSMANSNSRIIVKAEAYRLKRVMDNLVSCALKHQKKGVVELKLEIPENNRVVFSVTCEGNAQLIRRAKAIFENNGSDDDWHNQLDNTGVVYKLTRDLTEAMGGTVSLNSSEDDGKVDIMIDFPVHSIEQKDINGAKLHDKGSKEIPAFNSN